MTINAAPDPAYEAYCDGFPAEGTPEYREMHGDYIETLTAYPERRNIFGHHLGMYGGFTRYRGEFDLAQYGDCVVDRDQSFREEDFHAAHFMTD
jgi:hypothetical protein